MLRLVLACFFLASVVSSSWASMEVVMLETFEGVKTLNATNPGNLGEWLYGNWHCRPVGPRVEGTSGYGWSGDSQGEMTCTRWDLTAAPFDRAQKSGMVGCWVRFESVDAAGYYSGPLVANPALVLKLAIRSDNSPFQMIGVGRDGALITREDGMWTSKAFIQKQTWYWVQIEWMTSDTQFSAKASYQQLGGVLTELSVDTVFENYQATGACVMNGPYTVAPFFNYSWRGRLGAAVLAKIDAIGSGQQMPDILPPVEERHTWYLDPFGGDDQNDGLSPGQAWKTVSKFNQESAHAGLLSPRTGGYDNGDQLVVDTSRMPLELGAGQWLVKTPALTIKPAEGQDNIWVQAHKDISAAATAWTLFNEQTHPHVWMTTDGNSQDLTDVVIWEDDRWLNHPTGQALANVIDALNETPGSFYSDGTNLYLHPFDSSNPNTDGKIYTRSRFRLEGGSAVMLLSQNLCVSGIDVRKTALARSADNLPYSAYGIQGDQAFGGRILLRHCFVSYGGKHCIGFTDAGSNRDLRVEYCQVEQGTPYASQTPFVDYNGIADASGNRTTYYHCLNLKPAGKIGSTEGNAQEVQSYYTHNNGQGIQFSSIQFIGGTYAGGITAERCVDRISLEGVSFPSGLLAANDAVISRCVISRLPAINSLASGRLIARHNLFIFNEAVFYAFFNAPLTGTALYEGNTFDLRPYTKGNDVAFSLFNRTGPLSLTFRNNVFIVPPELQFNVIENARSTDELKFSHNVYQMGAGGLVVRKFHTESATVDCSLSEWQGRGYDTASLATDAGLSAEYIPGRGSPVVFSGADLGLQPDFSGRVFPSRRSIGAYEPPETYAEWQVRNFSVEDLTAPEVSGGSADPDQDGLDNGLEFALGQDPMITGAVSRLATRYERVESGPVVTIDLERSFFTDGVSLGLDISADLINWTNETAGTLEDIAFNASRGTIHSRLRYELGRNPPPRLFMRLKSTLSSSP